MATLSISRAWDETKARVAADGRLMLVVAAALIALPALVTGVVSPASTRGDGSLLSGLIILAASLVALIGQLAIIHMALGSSVSVGEAISHGARRMPIYFIAAILILIALILALVPFGLVLIAAGVPLDRGNEAILASPVAVVLLLLYFALLCFVAIRMLMSSPVASEESVGPIEILRRSWELTAGNWWRLFGFLILFVIGFGIAMVVITWAFSAVAVLLFGPIEPMSASALLVALGEALLNTAFTVLLAVMLARIYFQLSGRESIDVSVPKSGT